MNELEELVMENEDEELTGIDFDGNNTEDFLEDLEEIESYNFEELSY